MQLRKRNIIFEKKIPLKIKIIQDFFQFFIFNLKKENFYIKEKNLMSIIFKTKKSHGLLFELIDEEEENSITLKIYNSRIMLQSSIKKFIENQTFGMKNIYWILLLMIIFTTIPIISVGYFNIQVLRIGLIIIFSVLVVSFVIFYLYKKLRVQQLKKLNLLSESYLEFILKIILDYKEGGNGKVLCWNCFEEIDDKSKICNFCNAPLEKEN